MTKNAMTKNAMTKFKFTSNLARVIQLKTLGIAFKSKLLV